MDQTDGIQSKKPLNQFQVKENKDRFGKIQPDEGWAWLVCFGAHLWICLVGGTLKLNGVIFVEFQDLYNVGATAASWIGFAFGICMLISASISGCVVDNVSHQTLRIYLVVVVILTTASVALSSYMPVLPAAILTYGVLFGLLIGLADVAALSLVSLYFVKRRTLAFGLAFAGSPIGSLFLPFMFAATSDFCGFRGSMLIFSAIWLHGLFLPVFASPIPDKDLSTELADLKASTPGLDGFRTDSKNVDSTICAIDRIESNVQDETEVMSQSTHQTENSYTSPDIKPTITSKVSSVQTYRILTKVFSSYGKLLSSPGIPFLSASVFFGVFAYIGGFFMIPPLASEMGMDKIQTSTILMVSSVAELTSRVVIGALVDKCNISRAVILLSTYAVAGVTAVVVSSVASPYALYGYGFVTGGFAGSVVGLAIPMMMHLVDDTQKGSTSGLFAFITGLASALVPAIYGSVRDAIGTYRVCLYLGAAANLLGIILYFGSRGCNRFRHCKRIVMT